MKEDKLIIVGSETGEVRGEYKPRKKKASNPEKYVQIFIANLCMYNNIKFNLHPVILEILRLMDQNNEIVLDARRKNIISEKTGYKTGSIEVMINQLRQDKVLIHLPEKGNYMVNPHYFGRGNWNKIVSLRQKFEAVIMDNEGNKRLVEFHASAKGSIRIRQKNI